MRYRHLQFIPYWQFRVELHLVTILIDWLFYLPYWKKEIPFSADDVYLNVAGGYKLKETAADLSVALALFSVKYDIPLKKFCMALGEIGLTGEILPVSKLSLRLKEAVKMNFTEFVLPRGIRKRPKTILKIITGRNYSRMWYL